MLTFIIFSAILIIAHFDCSVLNNDSCLVKFVDNVSNLFYLFLEKLEATQTYYSSVLSS